MQMLGFVQIAEPVDMSCTRWRANMANGSLPLDLII